MTSAPASSSPCRSSTLRLGSGCPAVTYGTKALRFASRSEAKRAAMGSDEIVASPDAIPLWILGLDDGAQIHAVAVLLRQVEEDTRMYEVPLLVADDADHRTREHFGHRIHRVHDAQLERVEDDERTDRIDAGKVDERLHDHGIHAAARVVGHLLHQLRRSERHRLVRAPARRGTESVRHPGNR